MLSQGTGLLVPQGDARALAAAMAELIADPEKREAMGRAAAERARSFEAPSVLPRFERAYQATIAAGASRP
jgi:glycosyltransferase involved in cell wall biosynthesis